TDKSHHRSRKRRGARCRRQRKKVHSRHRRIVHPRNGDTESDRRQYQWRSADFSPRKTKRQTARDDGNDETRHDKKRRVLHMRACMQCGHANVMHAEDAAAHQASGEKKSPQRKRKAKRKSRGREKGPLLIANTATPTTSTHTSSESSVGNTR